MYSPKLAEIEVIYKPIWKTTDLEKVGDSNDLHRFLREHCFNVNQICHHETFFIILLNRSNRILGYKKISEGGLNETIVDVRLIMQTALNTNSSAIVLSHNHPSGNLTPSENDLKITKEIKTVAEFHKIKVLDHLILTDTYYYSFADSGNI